MNMSDIRQGIGSFWGPLAEGWQRLRDSAAGALTLFRPGAGSALPAPAEVDDAYYLPSQGWSMLGGDVFEDGTRIVVRLEVPGMDRRELDVEVRDDALVVSGEKRFERERTAGRYRTLQCAYGSFRRVVPLPVAVLSDKAEATYRDGVLRVELPKRQPGRPRRVTLRVS